MQSLDWVAVQEFYRESKCLLCYRLAASNTTQALPDNVGRIHDAELQHYLDTECRCHDKKTTIDAEETTFKQPTGKSADLVVQHHSEGKRTTMLDLPEHVLAKVATLTGSDTYLYSKAMGDFLREVVWSEDKLGRRVLCASSLTKVEPKLLYLGVEYHRYVLPDQATGNTSVVKAFPFLERKVLVGKLLSKLPISTGGSAEYSITSLEVYVYVESYSCEDAIND